MHTLAPFDPQAVADLMALSSRRLRISCETYHAMAEALLPLGRTELIDGHVIAMSPIGPAHAHTVYRIARLLEDAVRGQERGRPRIYVQSPLRLDDGTEPEPDLAVLRADLDETRIPTAADALLVVEVSDATERFDRTVKLPRYAAAGIPEVWIALPAARTVERYRQPTTDGYAERSRYQAGDELEALGGLLPVGAMFPAAD